MLLLLLALIGLMAPRVMCEFPMTRSPQPRHKASAKPSFDIVTDASKCKSGNAFVTDKKNVALCDTNEVIGCMGPRKHFIALNKTFVAKINKDFGFTYFCLGTPQFAIVGKKNCLIGNVVVPPGGCKNFQGKKCTCNIYSKGVTCSANGEARFVPKYQGYQRRSGTQKTVFAPQISAYSGAQKVFADVAPKIFVETPRLPSGTLDIKEDPKKNVSFLFNFIFAKK